MRGAELPPRFNVGENLTVDLSDFILPPQKNLLA
jgi:hypothetical protein